MLIRHAGRRRVQGGAVSIGRREDEGCPAAPFRHDDGLFSHLARRRGSPRPAKMGAQESSLRPEGDPEPRPRPTAPTAPSSTDSEHLLPSLPQRLPHNPGTSHPALRTATLGRSASGGNVSNQMGKSPQLQQAAHRRHHTWHHAPHKRAYDQTIWDIQGHDAAHGHRGGRSNWESDSESEMSEYSAPSVKRQASVAGSDCGERPPPRALTLASV